MSRLIGLLAAAFVAASPIAAFAQGGVITLSPVQAAPALAAPMLAALVAVLLLAAMKFLPPTATRKLSAVVVAAIVLSVVVAYAVPQTFHVSGENCQKPVTVQFDPGGGSIQKIQSDCANPIQVTELDNGCESGETLGTPRSISEPYCALGLVLGYGEICRLPFCS